MKRNDQPFRAPSEMPEELSHHLASVDAEHRRIVIANWHAVGTDGRRSYWQYLTAPRLRRTRRSRAKIAAQALLHPGGDSDIPRQGPAK